MRAENRIGVLGLGLIVLLTACVASPAWRQPVEEATRLNSKALQLHQQGRYKEAIPLAQRSIAIYEKALGPEHPAVATSLTILALLYWTLGDYTQAEPLYKRSLTILEKTSGPENPSIATSLNSLAFLYLEAGRHEEAFKIFKEQDAPMGLGRYYLATREYRQAEQQFLRSLKVTEKGGESEFLIAHHIGLGLAFEGQGNYSQAKHSFRRAIALIEQQWQALTLAARQHFLAGTIGATFSRVEPYEGMIRVLLKERQPGHEKEPLRYAERVKSRTFLELLAGRGVKGRRTQDQQVLAQDQKFQQSLTELTQRISVLQSLGSKAPQGEQVRLKQELDQRQAEV